MPLGIGEAQIGSAILGGIGSAIGGNSASKDRRRDREEERRQFNLQLQNQKSQFARQAGSAEGDQAVNTQRQLDMAPLRDRLLHTMRLRAGLAPQAMQAHDIFNPGISAQVPQLGGIDRGALQQGMAGYTPGAGGVNTQVMQQLIQRLGYDPTHPLPPGQQPFTPAEDPRLTGASSGMEPENIAKMQTLMAKYGTSGGQSIWAKLGNHINQSNLQKYPELYPGV